MASSTKQLFRQTDAGVLIPNGSVVELSLRKKTNFVSVMSRANQIEGMYASAGLTISPSCGLGRMVDNAKSLADYWLKNPTADSTMNDVYCALHLDRIADSILPLQDVPVRKKYLKDLMSGELDFFSRKRTYAKDILWELELWSILRRKHSGTHLQDPPDIVLALDGGSLGVACKKIYSERSVSKVLSEAVGQVEASFDVGVVALNLDELLLPASEPLSFNNQIEMNRFLQTHTDEFIKRHERHLRKYLSSGRIVSALVSVTAAVRIRSWKVQHNNARSSVAWTIPLVSPVKQALLMQFRKLVVQAHDPHLSA